MNNGLNANFHFLPVSRACDLKPRPDPPPAAQVAPPAPLPPQDREVGAPVSLNKEPQQTGSSRWRRRLTLGAGFLALRIPVDVAEEFGTRVRA